MMNYEKRDDGVVINKNFDDFKRYDDLRNRALREREMMNKISELENEIVTIKKALNKIYSRLT